MKRYYNQNDLVIIDSNTKAQLYDFGTPKSLKLSRGDTVYMKGYTRQVWEKVKKIERDEKEKLERIEKEKSERRGKGSGVNDDDEAEEEEIDLSVLERVNNNSSRNGSSLQIPSANGSSSTLQQTSRSPSPHLPQTTTTSSTSSEDLFRLTIRGSKTQSIDLAVKPTTLIRSLIKAYCKQFGIDHQVQRDRVSRMFIEIEGDKIDSNRTIDEVREEFGLDDEETMDLRDPGGGAGAA